MDVKNDFNQDEVNILNKIDNVIKECEKKKQIIYDTSGEIKDARKVNREFFRTKKKIRVWLSKLNKLPIPIEKELKEPVLFLIKENGYAEPIENVKAGEFTINTPKGMKSFLLTPDKIVTLKYGNQFIKCWFQYENCMSPYPENPLHSSDMFKKIVQKISMNYRDVNEVKMFQARTKFWLFLGGGIILGLFLLFSTPFGQNLISGGSKEVIMPVANVIAQNVSNAVGVIG